MKNLTWRTYSTLWAEVQLPRAALDSWMLKNRIRWLALNDLTRGDYSFLEGQPNGQYFCWEDIEPLWDDYRANDALRMLGDTEVPNQLGRAVHPGPHGWLPGTGRKR